VYRYFSLFIRSET
ncbi:hypothetical protein TNIN_429991, partial [Trichonephila inaurata madagascariensis]